MDTIMDGAPSGVPEQTTALGRFLSPIFAYVVVFCAGYLFAVFPDTALGRLAASVWVAS